MQDIGVELIGKALKDIKKGVIKRKPQDKRLSTWEPSTDAKDIFRPDCLLLNELGKNSSDTWY